MAHLSIDGSLWLLELLGERLITRASSLSKRK